MIPLIRIGCISLACTVLLTVAIPASAQVPPTAGELERYIGLHAAAHRGDVQAIERLIASGKAIDVVDRHGRTPLHVATHARKPEAVRALMRAGADHARLDRDRYDAVTIAAVANDDQTLRMLLAEGASARLVTSRYDGTALIAAAHLGHDGVVRQLIAAKAPLDHVNNLHWTAVIEAVVLGNGGPAHVATLRALVDAGADTNRADRNGVTPLQHARMRGYRDMVEILQRAGARP
jgi:ankyrin repeat protein